MRFPEASVIGKVCTVVVACAWAVFSRSVAELLLSPGPKLRVSPADSLASPEVFAAPAGFVAESAMYCGVGMYLTSPLPVTSTVWPGPVMSVCAPPCCAGRPVPGSAPKVTEWLPSIVWFTVMSQPAFDSSTLTGSQSVAVPAKSTLPEPRMPTVATFVFIRNLSRFFAAICPVNVRSVPRSRFREAPSSESGRSAYCSIRTCVLGRSESFAWSIIATCAIPLSRVSTESPALMTVPFAAGTRLPSLRCTVTSPVTKVTVPLAANAELAAARPERTSSNASFPFRDMAGTP